MELVFILVQMFELFRSEEQWPDAGTVSACTLEQRTLSRLNDPVPNVLLIIALTSSTHRADW
jgi:hypothetical protein